MPTKRPSRRDDDYDEDDDLDDRPRRPKKKATPAGMDGGTKFAMAAVGVAVVVGVVFGGYMLLKPKANKAGEQPVAAAPAGGGQPAINRPAATQPTPVLTPPPTIPADAPAPDNGRDEPTPAPKAKRPAAPTGTGIEIGQLAQDIDGEDIDGKKFKLTDYRGKVVVLDFWGHW